MFNYLNSWWSIKRLIDSQNCKKFTSCMMKRAKSWVGNVTIRFIDSQSRVLEWWSFNTFSYILSSSNLVSRLKSSHHSAFGIMLIVNFLRIFDWNWQFSLKWHIVILGFVNFRIIAWTRHVFKMRPSAEYSLHLSDHIYSRWNLDVIWSKKKATSEGRSRSTDKAWGQLFYKAKPWRYV